MYRLAVGCGSLGPLGEKGFGKAIESLILPMVHWAFWAAILQLLSINPIIVETISRQAAFMVIYDMYNL